MSDQPQLLPSGAGSVMAGRAAVEDDDQAGQLNYFPTPPWAARAGAEQIAALDPLVAAAKASCWEPACGEGHMAHGLADYFPELGRSDIHNYGGNATFDFLSRAPAPLRGVVSPRWDWIVTNPPFKDGEAFFRAAWPRARRGVAMLLRLAFIESAARFALFHDIPLTVLAPFSERVPMVKGRWDPEASSATAYAWFICAKDRVGHGLGPSPLVRLIGPGTRSRLTRTSDLVRFAGAPDQGELLGEGES